MRTRNPLKAKKEEEEEDEREERRERKSIILLEGSQATPARPSGRNKVKAKKAHLNRI
jgi:hypothetical protein